MKTLPVCQPAITVRERDAVGDRSSTERKKSVSNLTSHLRPRRTPENASDVTENLNGGALAELQRGGILGFDGAATSI